MRFVYLHNNQLIGIPNIRSLSKTLVLLSLDGNNILSVMPMYGIYFPRLYSLQLSFNRITSFCFPPWHFAPLLQYVYLQSNELSTIAFPIRDTSFKSVVLVRLLHNPWHCNGSLGWAQQCTHVAHDCMLCMEWLNVADMTCASPLNVAGLSPYEAGMLFLRVLSS